MSEVDTRTNFEDFCPDLMKNEKAAQWIEKEGDKARVFAVKMAGLKDNPSVSDNIKKMISTPEGMVELYQSLYKKFSKIDEKELDEIFSHISNMDNLDSYKLYAKKLDDFSSYHMLLNNDAKVLTPQHWKQCYNTTSAIKGPLLETLGDEARIYEEKQKLQARKEVLNNIGSMSKEQDKPCNMIASTQEKTSSKKNKDIPKTYKLGKSIKGRQSRA